MGITHKGAAGGASVQPLMCDQPQPACGRPQNDSGERGDRDRYGESGPDPKSGATSNAHAAFSFRGTRADCLTFPIRWRGCKERVTSNFDFAKFRLITGSNLGSSTSLRCDHCRAKLGPRVHHYWRMRFCSANCVATYQKRLSAGTQAKIVKLDVDHTSLPSVSWRNSSNRLAIFAAIRRARPASRLSRVVFTLSRRVSKCLLRAKNSIQWFSHGIFVLRPHFLRHWAV